MAIQPEGLVCARCLVELEFESPSNSVISTQVASGIIGKISNKASAGTVSAGSTLAGTVADDSPSSSGKNVPALSPIFPISSFRQSETDTGRDEEDELELKLSNSTTPTPLAPNRKVYRFDGAHAEPKNQPVARSDDANGAHATETLVAAPNRESSRRPTSVTPQARGNESKSTWVSLNDMQQASELMSPNAAKRQSALPQILATTGFVIGQTIVIGASIQGLGSWGIVGGIVCSLSFFAMSRHNRWSAKTSPSTAPNADRQTVSHTTLGLKQPPRKMKKSKPLPEIRGKVRV